MRGTFVSRGIVAFAALILVLSSLARPAAAQSGTGGAIMGQVTDESGGVLPGATVTATSSALQVPSVVDVTNENGEYRLSPLPIGTYVVEYALSGFQSVKREDIRLTAGFTAKIDMQLKVGELAETITVSGAAPVVDVSSTSTSTHLTQEVLDLIPTSRDNFTALMVNTPGARPNLDVGGSVFISSPVFAAFGQQGETWQSLDGMPTVSPKYRQSGQQADFSSFEEATVETSGHNAEYPRRGLVVNTVLKSGSNDYHGTLFGAYTNPKFESNNIDEELEALGITGGGELVKRYDVSADLGGRIFRDKLWFWGNIRRRENIQTEIACTTPSGGACHSTDRLIFGTAKVTYQLSKGNRFTGFNQWANKFNSNEGSRLVAYSRRLVSSPTDLRTGAVDYQGVRGNSLTLSFLSGRYRNSGDDRGGTPGVPAMRDRVTGYQFGGFVIQGGNSEYRYHSKGSLTWYKPDFISGNHEFKTGFDYASTAANRGQPYRLSEYDSPNYSLEFRSGVADRLVTTNSPVSPDNPQHYFGVYVQDGWALKRRLTLNIGLRYAHDNLAAAAQCREAADAPGDVAYPAECFDKVQMPVFNSVAPRFFLAYDVSGDGRTLVKGGWGRYQKMREFDELAMVARNLISTTTYRWRDPNLNGLYDPGEVNLDVNGGDFISTVVRGQTGAIIGGVTNPNEKQPFTDELMAQFDRELIPNLGARFTFVYRKNGNTYRLLNTLRPPDVFTIPVTGKDPGPDGVLNTGDDTGTSITYFEYPTSLAGAAFQRPILVNDSRANADFKTIEAAVAKRYANGWQINASYTATQKHIPLLNNVGGANDVLGVNSVDPNAEIFAEQRTWEWLLRLSGAYMFPYKVLVSANFENRSGEPFARTFEFSGGKSIPSIVLRVEPVGTQRRENNNILTMRAEKTISLFKSQQAIVRLNLFNLLNDNSEIVSGWGALDDTVTQKLSGPNYLVPGQITPPRIIEFSVSYKF